jgi:hypothetical protein
MTDPTITVTNPEVERQLQEGLTQAIEWATSQENPEDVYRAITWLQKLATGLVSRLAMERAKQMQKLYEDGWSEADLAKLFELSKPRIHQILTR